MNIKVLSKDLNLNQYREFIISNYDNLENNDFSELTFHPLTPQLLHDEAQNYNFRIDELNSDSVYESEENQKILKLPWDWKRLHTHHNFVWYIILYYSEKLDRDAIHLYSKLNWCFVFDYRNHPFWDWDKLSSRSDSFKFMKRCKNMPWRWEPMIRTFDTSLEFWEYVCKNYNSVPKSVFKKLSSNINFPLEILGIYSKDLWDWKSISKLEHLNVHFVRDNTNLPWNWEIIKSRF